VDAAPRQIERKIAVARTIQWICFVLVVGPVGCVIIYLAALFAGEDSEGQEWIATGDMSYVVIGGSILLIPLLGFLGAWARKIELRHKLGAYRTKGRE